MLQIIYLSGLHPPARLYFPKVPKNAAFGGPNDQTYECMVSISGTNPDNTQLSFSIYESFYLPSTCMLLMPTLFCIVTSGVFCHVLFK